MTERTAGKVRGLQTVASAVLCICTLSLLLPGVRSALMRLANRVMAVSEAVNAYTYQRFAVQEGSVLPAVVLVTLACMALFLLTVCARHRWPVLIWAGVLAIGQAWLGLSLPAAVNVPCFGILALLMVRDRLDRRAAAAMIAAILTGALIICILLPGVNSWVESASEWVRDRLDGVTEIEQPDPGQPEGPAAVRHENRRDALGGTGEARPGTDYRLVTEAEQQIAQPRWVDWLQIIGLCLLIPAVLAGPFLPFVWMNGRRRIAAQKRAAFDSQDRSEAMRAMFAHVIAWLDACGVGDAAALHAHRLDRAAAPVDDAYVQQYGEVCRSWQRTVYGAGIPSDDECRAAAELLKAT